MDKNITDLFVDNLYAFSREVLSDDLRMHARKCLLDYLASTVAGRKEYMSIEDGFLQLSVASGSVSSVIGTQKKTTPAIAALINGISAHAVDGEAEGLKVSDLWNGILTGYEAAIRLACSIQPVHKLKGFHATGPCGTIGAAIGIASMLGFSRAQYKAAFTTACTSASGILEMIEGDTQMMPYNAGKAAANAVISAAIGRSGFKIPKDALGGGRGFLYCFADASINKDLLTVFGDTQFCISNYFKCYAACGHCHASIDAALKLREKHLFKIEDIEKVEIQTYKLALKGHDHTTINGVNSARMSIPYSTIIALLKGTANIEDFDENSIKNKKVLDLTKKVIIYENEDLTRQAPAKRMAIVSIYTSHGVYTEKVEYPRGQPENPMTMDDIIKKFYDCSQYAGVSTNSTQKIVNTVLNNSEVSISELMNALTM